LRAQLSADADSRARIRGVDLVIRDRTGKLERATVKAASKGMPPSLSATRVHQSAPPDVASSRFRKVRRELFIRAFARAFTDKAAPQRAKPDGDQANSTFAPFPASNYLPSFAGEPSDLRSDPFSRKRERERERERERGRA
jgi:hypothetical protein